MTEKQKASDSPTAADTPEAAAQAGGARQPWQRLNAFQRVMLLWDEVHPYNAAHAVVMTGECDVERLARAAGRACREAGIGPVQVDARGQRLAYQAPADTVERGMPLCVRAVKGAEQLADHLDELLTTELNTRFSAARPTWPFRLFVLRHEGHARFAVVLSYYHVVADAFAVQRLFGNTLRRYAGDHECSPLQVSRTGTLPCVCEVPGVWAKTRCFMATMRRYFRLRRAHKMHEKRDAGDDVAVLHRVWPHKVASLRQACHRLQAGANDACLAALALAIARITPRRDRHRRRGDVALGTIVSLRKAAAAGGVDLSESFGAYLSHALAVVHRGQLPLTGEGDVGGGVPAAPGVLKSVLREVARQTACLRRGRSFAGGGSLPFLVRRVWPWFHLKHERKSYTKLFPLCGGVSSSVVDADLFGPAAKHIEHYIRACPPGPAMPMVLAPTIREDALVLTLIYRKACLSEEQARGVLEDVVETLSVLPDAFGAAQRRLTLSPRRAPCGTPARPKS